MVTSVMFHPDHDLASGSGFCPFYGSGFLLTCQDYKLPSTFLINHHFVVCNQQPELVEESLFYSDLVG